MDPDIRITRIDWQPGQAEAVVVRVAKDAPANAADKLQAHAEQRVPYNTGALAASAQIESTAEGAALGYSAPYAPILHAHADDWTFQGGRSGHWLEEAIDEASADIAAAYADTARADWPGS